MKAIVSLATGFLLSISSIAQNSATTATLLPDQNPNFQKSRDLYMETSQKTTANEGVTLQQTYKAIDDVEIKKEQKALRAERRQERRMARIVGRHQPRNNYYSNHPTNSYGNYGYSQPYGCNTYYPQTSMGLYYPQYYSGNIYGNINSTLNAALLGLSIYSLLKK